MKGQVIKSKYFTVYLYDTSTTKQTYRNKYIKLLKKNIDVLDKWISAKIKNLKTEIEFSITLCGERKIKSLNSKYRHKNKITDVISFQMEENVMKLLKSKSFQFPVLSLGDIFICKEVAKKQAKEFNLKIEEEIIHLGIHGLLHLFAYDHELGESQAKKMFKEEELIAKKIFS